MIYVALLAEKSVRDLGHVMPREMVGAMGFTIPALLDAANRAAEI